MNYGLLRIGTGCPIDARWVDRTSRRQSFRGVDLLGNRHHKCVAFSKSSGDKQVTYRSAEPPNLPGRRGVKSPVV